MEQQYIDVLVDALGNKTLWAFTSEVRYFAMLSFGEADSVLATVMALIGACLGSFINYGIGRAFSVCQTNGISKIKPDVYDKWRGRFTYAILFIGIFSWIHLVGVLVAAAGFLKVPAKFALPSLVLGQVLYYGYQYSKFIGA